tara:strand:+ start:13415 stop:13723 length:309 start_codon:yes stop_codon:yes gene_type:complete
MSDTHISLKNLYFKIETFIESETENEMDELRNLFYDIIQERKNEINDKIWNDIIDSNENSCISNMNNSDLNIIIKGIGTYENLDDMIQGIFADPCNSEFGGL